MYLCRWHCRLSLLGGLYWVWKSGYFSLASRETCQFLKVELSEWLELVAGGYRNNAAESKGLHGSSLLYLLHSRHLAGGAAARCHLLTLAAPCKVAGFGT